MAGVSFAISEVLLPFVGVPLVVTLAVVTVAACYSIGRARSGRASADG
jgi:hypothetical protein